MKSILIVFSLGVALTAAGSCMATPESGPEASPHAARHDFKLVTPDVLTPSGKQFIRQCDDKAFAATELDLFTAIAGGHRTLAELAGHTRAAAEPLRLLLESCVAEGLLAKENGLYANTPATDAFLVRDRPTYAGHGLKYAENLYEAWGRLADLVRTGKPTIEPESILGDDKARTRAFVLLCVPLRLCVEESNTKTRRARRVTKSAVLVRRRAPHERGVGQAPRRALSARDDADAVG